MASDQTISRRIARRIIHEEIDGVRSTAQQDVYYDTYIDLRALDLLAVKAARSKRFEAKDGPVRVQVVNVRKVG